MKDYSIKNGQVCRKGEPIADFDSGGVTALPGQGRYLNMAKKFLKSTGYAGKTESESPQDVQSSVEETRSEAPESPPHTMTLGEIPVVEEMEPVAPQRRIFELPAGAKIENPPKDRVMPGHKATLYFQKNGFSRKLALEYVPTNEQAIQIIEEFTM
jgi:hypothetical protein